MTDTTNWVLDNDVDVRARSTLLLRELEHLLKYGVADHPEVFSQVVFGVSLDNGKLPKGKAAREHFEGAAAVCRWILRVGVGL
jgi:hypothetical protein